jgi:hypothetical protein
MSARFAQTSTNISIIAIRVCDHANANRPAAS